jgi:hypothetical protein
LARQPLLHCSRFSASAYSRYSGSPPLLTTGSPQWALPTALSQQSLPVLPISARSPVHRRPTLFVIFVGCNVTDSAHQSRNTSFLSRARTCMQTELGLIFTSLAILLESEFRRSDESRCAPLATQPRTHYETRQPAKGAAAAEAQRSFVPRTVPNKDVRVDCYAIIGWY